MPVGGAPYPHNSELARYFVDFADRFRLRDAITFHTEVVGVAPTSGAGNGSSPYDVTVRSLDTGEKETRRYDAILVASGHHWDPSWPRFPGSRGGGEVREDAGFNGVEIHSHAYRSPERPVSLEGRRVLVVGIGN